LKPLFCYSTILFYSLFSFAFATICPAVCLTMKVEAACEQACGAPVISCDSPCSRPCKSTCVEVDPIACCSGAYGTQNSLRLAVECPAPDKSHAYTELNRIFKDLDVSIISVEIKDVVIPSNDIRGVIQAPQSTLISSIIASTVLRI
jgi:hypothetical protein